MKFYIKRYNTTEKKNWDTIVALSKNATFMFFRDYMDYHKDRFFDYSLLIYKDLQIIALFPASYHQDRIMSHGGLTYGGLLTTSQIGAEDTLIILNSIIEYYRTNGIKSILYKAIPHIYHKTPSEEDLYALNIHGFKLFRRDISSTLNFKYQSIKGKKQNGAKRALKAGFTLVETSDSTSILEVFNYNLIEKYSKIAIHNSHELNTLKENFQSNIKFYNLLYKGEIHGGTVLFISNNVVHTQYVATSSFAKQNRGLDLIIYMIFELFNSSQTWFDYGISTENDGKYLNTALIQSKEEFNFQGICYDTYIKEL